MFLCVIFICAILFLNGVRVLERGGGITMFIYGYVETFRSTVYFPFFYQSKFRATSVRTKLKVMFFFYSSKDFDYIFS